jgi:hypothetical protein
VLNSPEDFEKDKAVYKENKKHTILFEMEVEEANPISTVEYGGAHFK